MWAYVYEFATSICKLVNISLILYVCYVKYFPSINIFILCMVYVCNYFLKHYCVRIFMSWEFFVKIYFLLMKYIWGDYQDKYIIFTCGKKYNNYSNNTKQST